MRKKIAILNPNSCLLLSVVLFLTLMTMVEAKNFKLPEWLVKKLAVENATIRVTFKIVDENGNPIEKANVSAGFRPEGIKPKGVKGLTDAKGLFLAEGVTADGYIGYGADKKGYYETMGEFWLKNGKGDFEKKNGRWLPWNPTITVVLRKKINPVPMYAKNVDLDIPKLNNEIGFDFTAADWVAPYGKGEQVDVLIKLEGFFKNGKNWKEVLSFKFPNKLDGIQGFVLKNYSRYNPSDGSVFKMPRFAPEKGYQRIFTMTSECENGVYNSTPEQVDGQCYFFRIRTKVDDKGNILKAMYGKIREEGITVNIRYKNLAFLYYLNPDHTRNMEFDPGRNLLIPKGANKFDSEYNDCTGLAP